VRFAEPTNLAAYQDRHAIALEDPDCFARMEQVEFAQRFDDTPLERPGLAGMRRNWAAAYRSLSSEDVK
jgi:hypothetical protein